MEDFMLFLAKAMTLVTCMLCLIAPVVVFFGMIYGIWHDLRCADKKNGKGNEVRGTFVIHSPKPSKIVKIEEFSNTDPRDKKFKGGNGCPLAKGVRVLG